MLPLHVWYRQVVAVKGRQCKRVKRASDVASESFLLSF